MRHTPRNAAKSPSINANVMSRGRVPRGGGRPRARRGEEAGRADTPRQRVGRGGGQVGHQGCGQSFLVLLDVQHDARAEAQTQGERFFGDLEKRGGGGSAHGDSTHAKVSLYDIHTLLTCSSVARAGPRERHRFSASPGMKSLNLS